MQKGDRVRTKIGGHKGVIIRVWTTIAWVQFDEGTQKPEKHKIDNLEPEEAQA